MGKMERVKTLAGADSFDVYVAEPTVEATAAVIVIQEIFGVNPGIREKCDQLAAAGYLAMAPDLFWRIRPGIELDADVEADFQQALGHFGAFDQDQGIRDLEATIHVARARVARGKVGCVGYCLGGRLAFMCAARTDIDASVGYYAVGIDNLLRESHAIAHPLMLHIAAEDGFVPKDMQATMHAGLDGHLKVTLHDYPGMDHGFAAQHGNRRDEANAKIADERTMAFFAENLG